MKNLEIEATDNSPYIKLEADDHRLYFEGDSRPEEVQKFFKPVLDWLEEYDKYLYYVNDKLESEITITSKFRFQYFNSSSAKFIMDILEKLKTIDENYDKVNLAVNWYYDEMDEDMMESGQEFESLVGVKVNLIENF